MTLTEFIASEATYIDRLWGGESVACVYEGCHVTQISWIPTRYGPRWIEEHDEDCPLLAAVRELWAMGTSR